MTDDFVSKPRISPRIPEIVDLLLDVDGGELTIFELDSYQQKTMRNLPRLRWVPHFHLQPEAEFSVEMIQPERAGTQERKGTAFVLHLFPSPHLGS